MRKLKACVRRTDVRLLTLTGPGGVGKTRVAVQVAAGLRDDFDDILTISLAPLTDPALVLPAIAQALSIPERAGQTMLARLSAALYGQRLLVILDNFEHLPAAVPDVAALLAVAPSLSILATSRAPLRVRGEYVYPLPPLALPDLARLPDIDALTRIPAIALFVQRAQGVSPDFQVNAVNQHIIAELCVRLDGLPLALELAAARLSLLTPHEIVARLDHCLTLLTHGSRDLPDRHQALRASLNWSYSLLDADSQAVFRRLAVFSDGCTIAAAEAVCGLSNNNGDELDVLAALTKLIENSLIGRTDRQSSETRLTLLETIRAYALEHLIKSGEEAATRHAHLIYYVTMAEEANATLHGRQQQMWMDRWQADHANVRTALRWALDYGKIELAARLSISSTTFWQTRGYIAEGRSWLEATLAVLDSTHPLRAKILVNAGKLAWMSNAIADAQRWLTDSLNLFRHQTDVDGVAQTLQALALVAITQGDHPQAIKLYTEALALLQPLGLGTSTLTILCNLGLAYVDVGEQHRGVMYISQALDAARHLGNSEVIAFALLNLGLVAYQQGDYARLGTLCQESLAHATALGAKRPIALSMLGLAAVAGIQGQRRTAARLLGAAEVLREQIGTPLLADERVRFYTDVVATTRAHLSETMWQDAWAEGRSLSLADALTLARSVGMSAIPEPTSSVLPAGLTAREAEVLGLVAQGLTDADIAVQLVLSRRTVNAHVRTIYQKIGVTTRVAATRYASAHHLA